MGQFYRKVTYLVSATKVAVVCPFNGDYLVIRNRGTDLITIFTDATDVNAFDTLAATVQEVINSPFARPNGLYRFAEGETVCWLTSAGTNTPVTVTWIR